MSSTSSPDPVNCPWLQTSPDLKAECGLLRQLTGLVRGEGCAVSGEACGECLKWYSPSPRNLNPVVASLLFRLAADIRSEGGRGDCTKDHADKLYQSALSAIPVEDDAVPLSAFIQDQQNTTISEICSLIPRPRNRCGPRVREWAVAVTTAPRQQATLDHCLQSLAIAGWANPRIVIDGDVSIPERWRMLPVTQRLPKIGAWPSYYLTLIELLMRSPGAEAFMIVQDDVVFFQHPGLREYMESVLWPGDQPGIVSLYCSRAYAASEHGWHSLNEPLIWGGQVLVFSRETLLQLIADPEVTRHRFTEFGLANIDGVIGKWAFETNTPVHVCSPSLSQHIGHVSALWTTKAFANRSAAEFAGNCNVNARSTSQDRRP
ncbi:MAG: hypothetical protein KDA89_18080 [Planctomycetaceae bacterium]|nr:hypothetical protein [Planctomycetaceae bacterium]